MIASRHRQAPPVASRRRAPPRARVRRVAAHSASADRTVRRGLRRLVRGRPRAHAGVSAAGRGRAHRRGAGGLPVVRARLLPIVWAIALYVVVAVGGSVYAGIIQRFVVGPNEQVRETPYIVHNIRATREAFALDQVEERPLLGRRAADARGPRAQRRDDRERAAVERSAAARYVRPDPGDPHLLRLRLGRQRSLHHQRQVPADHAVGARAELAQPAEPHLDQRAADVHARLRPDARPGQRGHAAKGCRCCSSATCRSPRPST